MPLLVLQDMEGAREQVLTILRQPQTDLEQLHGTVKAQTEQVSNVRAAKDVAIVSLAQCSVKI